jgi:hypothetical protein
MRVFFVLGSLPRSNLPQICYWGSCSLDFYTRKCPV